MDILWEALRLYGRIAEDGTVVSYDEKQYTVCKQYD